jgi:serine/threonine protein kinase
MEYFEGKPLDSFVEEHGPLSEKQALKCIKSLADCVDRLHSLGIAHRDIKPQNLLINHEFEIKLVDFNISKKGKDSETQGKFSKRFMTQVSSPLFAAPEILSPDFYTESVDIWGIGIILVTMLFGMRIFEAATKLSNKEKHSQFIMSLEENVTESLDEPIMCGDESLIIIKATLAFDSESRLTAKELSNLVHA